MVLIVVLKSFYVSNYWKCDISLKSSLPLTNTWQSREKCILSLPFCNHIFLSECRIYAIIYFSSCHGNSVWVEETQLIENKPCYSSHDWKGKTKQVVAEKLIRPDEPRSSERSSWSFRIDPMLHPSINQVCCTYEQRELRTTPKKKNTYIIEICRRFMTVWAYFQKIPIYHSLRFVW